MGTNIKVNIQSSIKITGSKTIYFDPWQIEDEPHDADFVFITHEHYDHFSPKDIDKVASSDTHLILPKSMSHFSGQISSIQQNHVVSLVAGETREVARILVETYPAYNQKKPFHIKRNGWLGYIVTLDATRFYVAGDTDAVPEIRDVRCDVAFLPIGGTYTMDASQAAALVKKISPRVVVPTHYGCVVGSPVDGEFFQGLLPRGIKCEVLL